MRRPLSQQDLDNDPYARWNSFVDLLATEEFDALNSAQRVAHLAFWYDSEVQNGGHLQYFLNEAGARAEQAIEALRSVGGVCQADVLAAALAQWLRAKREAPGTSDEVVEAALEGEFEDFDTRYSVCEPSVTELLETYLEQHEAEFLDVGGR